MNKIRTQEEKVAKTLHTILNDLTLDLEQVGFYLARNSRNVSFRRLNEVVESANYEKEALDVRASHNPLF